MTINEKLAHYSNYNPNLRSQYSIKYVVIHYTGNVNDTAAANCQYFSGANRGASAHYFVDSKEVWRSVPDLHAAYSVGLGSRKTPYSYQSMYGVITNSNSISIEICGGPGSLEGTQEAKIQAAELCAELLIKYALPLDSIYRHYDVTGKICPAWAVEHPEKWNTFKGLVAHFFNNKLEEQDDMTYEKWKEYMNKYLEEVEQQDPSSWSESDRDWVELNNIITGGRYKSNVTREELAAVVHRASQIK